MKSYASLVFYIGNGKVKGSIVQYEEHKKPLILTTRIRVLPYSETTDKKALELKIIKELDTLCAEIKTQDFTKPICAGIEIQNACILISSPWYISQTVHIKLAHEKPFTITESMISSAIEDASKSYKGREFKDIHIFEQKIVRVNLNGYSTNNPIGKKVTTMDMSVFLSFAESSFLTTLKDIVTKHVHVLDISIHSQSLALFSSVETMWKDTVNYIVIDITSELAELLIVRNSGISETASYPYGKDFLIKELAKILNTTAESAVSLLTLYQDKKLDELKTGKITESLDEVQKIWVEQFTKALGAMSVGIALPSKFFLFAPHDVSSIFANFIQKEEYQQFSFSEGRFEVYDVKVADVSGFCLFRENAQKDISLAMAAIFNNKF